MPYPHPYYKFETVGMIPHSYFEEERVIYGFTERVIDGDTIRVRHIPNYLLKRYILQNFHTAVYTNMVTPLSQRGIASETLSIRLYGIDCPELSKRRAHSSQPFATEAKEFTTRLCHHQIVKITLLRRDQYQRAVAKVQVFTQPPPSSSSSSRWFGRDRPHRNRTVDLSLELATAGLAELYTGGGAEYHHAREQFERRQRDAQRHRRGIWSLPAHAHESAAAYKQRLSTTPPLPTPTKRTITRTRPNHRVNGHVVVDATTTSIAPMKRTMSLGLAKTSSTASDASATRRRRPFHHQHQPTTMSRLETAVTGLELLG